MARLIKRKTIVVSTDQIVVISGRMRSATAWCPSCNATVDTLTMDRSTMPTDHGLLLLRHLIEGGSVHCIDEEEDQLVICLNSLTSRKPPDAS